MKLLFTMDFYAIAFFIKKNEMKTKGNKKLENEQENKK